jgi:hypothetical protein
MLVSMIDARVEPDVIADIRFMEEDMRLVIVLAGSLSRRELAAAVLTDLVATISGPTELLDEIRDVADSMAWSVRLEEDGAETVLTVF